MNAKLFKEIYGVERCKQVADTAGTNYEYFRQIASNHRRPSPELALKLVEASNGELDFASLLAPKAA